MIQENDDQILEYHKATLGKGFLFKRDGSLFTKQAYTNTDYMGSDRRLNLSLLCFLGWKPCYYIIKEVINKGLNTNLISLFW